MAAPATDFYYSKTYEDDVYEYRHVHVPLELRHDIPKQLMSEKKWREFGLQMSPGWIHWMTSKRVLCFRRKLVKEPAAAGEEATQPKRVMRQARCG